MDEKKRRILEKAGLHPDFIKMLDETDEALAKAGVTAEKVERTLAEIRRRLEQEQPEPKLGIIARFRRWLGP